MSVNEEIVKITEITSPSQFLYISSDDQILKLLKEQEDELNKIAAQTKDTDYHPQVGEVRSLFD